MKKIISILILTLLGSNLFAQFGAGVNFNFQKPRYIYEKYEGGGYVMTGGLLIDTGIGAELVGNYTFNDRVQCESSFTHLMSAFFFEEKDALILSLNTKYKFLKNSFRPYVGAGFSGVYVRHVHGVEGQVEKETDEITGLVFEPALGAYWDSGIIDNLCFNLQARASFDLTTGYNGLGYYRFSFGLNYFFNKKEEAATEEPQSRSY